MKELSIEEKAKAYDEALAHAKLLLKTIGNATLGNLVLKNEFENMFPELAETEDERIRKEMIFYFQEEIPQCSIQEHADKMKKFIAFLEKQSTPQVRTGLEWVNTIDNACDKRYLEEYAHGEYCHEQSFKWGFQEGVDWLEKQGEPTEINPSEFDSQLNRLLKQFESLPKEELASSLSFYLNVVQNDGTYKDEKQGEQKPYGQREECLDCQMNYAGECKGSCAKKRDEPKPVETEKGTNGNEREIPNTAWSEEDEKILSNIVDCIKNLPIFYESININGEDKTTERFICDAINWLKFLKDRVQPQSNWKPSEEQMDALCYVTNFDYGGYKATLVSLYEQLKKLTK